MRARRVLHHPAGHPYTAALPGGRRRGDVWDVQALVAQGIGVVHVHFGFETLSLDELERWINSLRSAGIGIVHTVHDLDNPHLDDQRSFLPLVDSLVANADAVVTLSHHAEARVRRRTGRRSVVVPHGAVVPIRARLRHRRLAGPRRGIYVHAAACRPNLDAEMIATVGERSAAVGGTTVHLRRGPCPRVRALVTRLRDTPHIALDLRPRLDDEELWRRIAGAAVVLLPYRWITHSGLLETCHDLGTPVLAPDVGALAEQGAEVLGDDVDGAIAGVLTRSRPTSICDRAGERARILCAHRDTYARLATR